MTGRKADKRLLYAVSLAVCALTVFFLTRSYYGAGRKRVKVYNPVTPMIPRVSFTPAQAGDRYFEARQFDKAIEQYRKAIALDPKDADAYNDLGLSLHYTGRSKEAVETLREGAAADPSLQRLWLSLGFILTAMDKTKEASAALKTCVEIDPNSAQGREAKQMMLRSISRPAK